MGITERKGREWTKREHLIIATARKIAEAEGWNAVTIRRLAEEIEYSQPVLYSHFENRDAIVTAVAAAGFEDLASTLRQTELGSQDRPTALENVAKAYLAFASKHPALYEAMFTLPTGLRFAEADTRSELSDAFASLASVVSPSEYDIEVATETFWGSLHGLAELERSGRIRHDMNDDRVAIIVSALRLT